MQLLGRSSLQWSISIREPWDMAALMVKIVWTRGWGASSPYGGGPNTPQSWFFFIHLFVYHLPSLYERKQPLDLHRVPGLQSPSHLQPPTGLSCLSLAAGPISLSSSGWFESSSPHGLTVDAIEEAEEVRGDKCLRSRQHLPCFLCTPRVTSGDAPLRQACPS